mgnify:CR=1 FL=1
MFTSINEFSQEWNQEAASTQKVLDALTDESLQQPVSTEDRTLGRIAWHIVTSTPGMVNEFGITITNVENADTTPSSAQEIADTFRKVTAIIILTLHKEIDTHVGDNLNEKYDTPPTITTDDLESLKRINLLL